MGSGTKYLPTNKITEVSSPLSPDEKIVELYGQLPAVEQQLRNSEPIRREVSRTLFQAIHYSFLLEGKREPAYHYVDKWQAALFWQEDHSLHFGQFGQPHSELFEGVQNKLPGVKPGEEEIDVHKGLSGQFFSLRAFLDRGIRFFIIDYPVGLTINAIKYLLSNHIIPLEDKDNVVYLLTFDDDEQRIIRGRFPLDSVDQHSREFDGDLNLSTDGDLGQNRD